MRGISDLSQSAFLCRCTFLAGFFTIIGQRLASMKTASLSDMIGKTSHRLVRDFLLVKKRSSVLAL